jgi:hypothetical protein
MKPINFKNMKRFILCLPVFLFVAINCFSQQLQKKQSNVQATQRTQQQKATTSTKQEKIIAAPINSSANSKRDARFSCKIDGKDFSGKGTDEIGNAAYANKPGIISFVLTPIVAGQTGVPAQLAFKVANKGTTTIHGKNNPNNSVRYTPPNTLDNDYQCKEITVTITSSGTSRVTGTFSGTLIEWKTERDVPVTNGKFDIPYSSYSKK